MKVLRVGTLSRVGSIDPRKAIDAVSSVVLNEIFERLFHQPFGNEAPEPNLLTAPLVAEGPGAKAWMGTLRSGIHFSDGTAMTAQIVAKSLNGSPNFARQATAEATGDRILFRLTKANPRFDLVLAANYCSIVLDKPGWLAGSGPFMFSSITTTPQVQKLDRVTLIRNPHYRHPSDLDEISFITYPMSATGGRDNLLEAARKGEIDFTYSLSSVDAAALRGSPFVPWISNPNSTSLLQLNVTRPALSDANVRRAISHAIDRRAIAESMYERNPLAYIASSMLPPLMGRDQHVFSFDPAKAKQFAEAAGSAMPKQLPLLVLWTSRPYMPNPGKAAELIREQLAAIGITVSLITPKSPADYFDTIDRGSYDLLMGGWIADTVDPADFLEATLASYSIPGIGKDTPTDNNASRWVNATMDALLDKFRADPTDANRAAVMKMVVDEVPLVPLIYGQSVAVYSHSVMRFKASALGRCQLANLQLR